MPSLDSSIVNVALPTMSVQLNGSLADLQWVITVYLLTMASMLPVFGRLADLFGRKQVYLSGLIVFVLGSALCGLANNILFLVGMRVIQAIGASMLMSNSQALIVSSFSEHERGRALALNSTMVAVGALIGPAIGGILVGVVGWHSIFYINIPIGIIIYIVGQVIFPIETTNHQLPHFDYLGAMFFSVSLISFLFACNNTQERGLTPTSIISVIMGLILFYLFVLTEQRTPGPIIDLNIYKNKPFLIGNISTFISFTGQSANIILMPFYLQDILNYSSVTVGLFMLAGPLSTLIVAPISGYLCDKKGPLLLTTGGLLGMAGGLFYLSSVSGHSGYYEIMPGPILIGIGAGMFNSPNNSSVMSSVSREMLGIAGGLNALAKTVGMVVGTTLSVSLFKYRQAAALSEFANYNKAQYVDAFMSAFHTVVIVSGVIVLFGSFISANRKGYKFLNSLRCL